MRNPSIALALLLLCAACSDKPNPELVKLEAEKRELLASTVPRQPFWDEVARKGNALREKKEVEQEIARADAKVPPAEDRVAQLDAARLDADKVNEQAETLAAEARRRRADLQQQVAALDQKLARWHASPAASAEGTR